MRGAVFWICYSFMLHVVDGIGDHIMEALYWSCWGCYDVSNVFKVVY